MRPYHLLMSDISSFTYIIDNNHITSTEQKLMLQTKQQTQNFALKVQLIVTITLTYFTANLICRL